MDISPSPCCWLCLVENVTFMFGRAQETLSRDGCQKNISCRIGANSVTERLSEWACREPGDAWVDTFAFWFRRPRRENDYKRVNSPPFAFAIASNCDEMLAEQ